MISRVEVHTRRGTQLDLPLEDVGNGYLIDEITGTDPVKAILVSSGFANQEGETFHSAKREKRNMQIKIDFNPDWVNTTVSSLRKHLNSFLMPKSDVMLRFVMDDGWYVEIRGRVESNEQPQFTQEPGAAVTLVCFDPDFVDPNPKSSASGTSSLATDVTSKINYDGNVEAGILFRFNPNRPLTGFTLQHEPPDGTLRQLEFNASLLAGDKVVISTIPGAKGATLTRAEVVSSILHGVSPASNWIELQEGENKFRVYAVGASVPYSIEWVNRYGDV